MSEIYIGAIYLCYMAATVLTAEIKASMLLHVVLEISSGWILTLANNIVVGRIASMERTCSSSCVPCKHWHCPCTCVDSWKLSLMPDTSSWNSKTKDVGDTGLYGRTTSTLDSPVPFAAADVVSRNDEDRVEYHYAIIEVTSPQPCSSSLKQPIA